MGPPPGDLERPLLSAPGATLSWRGESADARDATGLCAFCRGLPLVVSAVQGPTMRYVGSQAAAGTPHKQGEK